MLTSSRVRALNAAFEAGSFSAAAKRLNVSQPAVNQQIRDLERGFGVSLFDRRGNGLVPTTLCQQLYGVTARLQDYENEAVAILSQHQELRGGELRVGLGNSMPGMALIASFQRLYPNIQIHVEMGSWSQIIDAAVDQRIDVGVLPEVPNDGRFRLEVCLYQGVVAIAHSEHPLTRRRTLTCADLTSANLIFRTRQSSTQRVVDRAFREAGLKPVPKVILDTRDGVVEAVANEMGIGFIWEQACSRTDQIVRLPVSDMSERLPEHIFCLAGNRDKLVDLFFNARVVSSLR